MRKEYRDPRPLARNTIRDYPSLMTNLDRLKKLCAAVYAVSPQAEIRFSADPANSELWSVIVTVGDVIVATSKTSPLEESLQEVSRSLGLISARMMKAFRPEEDEKP